MANNVSVRLVFDRKGVATKKRKAPVSVCITHNRSRKYLTTGVRLYSDQWSPKTGAVKNHLQADQLNRQISQMVTDIYDISQKLMQEGGFSFEKLERAYQSGADGDSDGFTEFMRKQIDEHPVSDSTRMRYISAYRGVVEFGKLRSFADVTYQNILAFDMFVRTKCRKQAAVYNYHKVLKIFVRQAYALQLIPSNPYLMFKMDKGLTAVRKFLTKGELAKVEARSIENECLAKVRDVFLFCCYTGLAYADLLKFDFTKAELCNGMYRIHDFRKKTGTEYNISLMDKAVAILKKYSFRLPVISNQKYNSYLKVLGAFCEIGKKLTSHVARHTFATTVMMANGVRIEVISKMLGHTNIQTTQLYAKTMQSEIDNEFNRVNALI